jgi:chemotaxis protein MotA
VNPSTIAGIVIGFCIVIAAIAFSTGSWGVFVNLPGLVLVLGGTVAATLISYPLREVLRVLKVFMVVLRNERMYEKEDVEELVGVAKLISSGQAPKIEDQLTRIKSPFLRTGIQLVADGVPLADIQDLLEWRISRLRAKERAEASIFRSMGAYAPAFGLVGTLLGLVNMLQNLGAGSIDVIGANLALALVTTFYGILLANLVFVPVAVKLEGRTEQRVALLNMVMEGVRLVKEERPPSYIRETLRSFMENPSDEVADHGAAKYGVGFVR